jgi:hypothetical protein
MVIGSLSPARTAWCLSGGRRRKRQTQTSPLGVVERAGLLSLMDRIRVLSGISADKAPALCGRIVSHRRRRKTLFAPTSLSSTARTVDEAVLVMAIFGLHSLMLAQQSEAARITDGWHSACLTR